MESTNKPSVWMVLLATATIAAPFIAIVTLCAFAEWRDRQISRHTGIPKSQRRYE